MGVTYAREAQVRSFKAPFNQEQVCQRGSNLYKV